MVGDGHVQLQGMNILGLFFLQLPVTRACGSLLQIEMARGGRGEGWLLAEENSSFVHSHQTGWLAARKWQW